NDKLNSEDRHVTHGTPYLHFCLHQNSVTMRSEHILLCVVLIGLAFSTDRPEYPVEDAFLSCQTAADCAYVDKFCPDDCCDEKTSVIARESSSTYFPLR